MAFWYYEGTKDYLVQGLPAVVLTFKASGSISPGRLVWFDAGGTSDVYQATLAIDTAVSGQIGPVGVALHTASDDDPVAVLVWGVVKNLSMANTSETVTVGENLSCSGSGNFTSGSTRIIGRLLSGSASRFMAFIDCMKIQPTD